MKVLTALLKYDYGIKERGLSLEYKVFYPAIKNNVSNVAAFWLEDNGYPNDPLGLQKKLLIRAEEERPDCIFMILMNDEIHWDTIGKLSKIYNTINWFCDDQWRFDTFSSKVAPFLQSIITVDKYSISRYKKLGKKKVYYSQWATQQYISNLKPKEVSYKYDISFVGSKNLIREWYISELEKRGIFVECFGSGWINGRVSQQQMEDIFYHSKINLNLSNSQPVDLRFFHYKKKYLLKNVKIRKNVLKYIRNFLKIRINIYKTNNKNIEQIKARNFEIPGCGGFQLTQYAPELEDYYIIGKELAIFTTIEDLALQIEYFLNADGLRRNISEEGYLRTVNYTYEERIKQLFKELEC